MASSEALFYMQQVKLRADMDRLSKKVAGLVNKKINYILARVLGVEIRDSTNKAKVMARAKRMNVRVVQPNHKDRKPGQDEWFIMKGEFLMGCVTLIRGKAPDYKVEIKTRIRPELQLPAELKHCEIGRE